MPWRLGGTSITKKPKKEHDHLPSACDLEEPSVMMRSCRKKRAGIHCRQTCPLSFSRLTMSMLCLTMLFMNCECAASMPPLEMSHPSSDLTLSDTSEVSWKFSHFTTGGCSGKRVSSVLYLLLVSLPTTCHAFNSNSAIAAMSSLGFLAHVSDGPVAFVQWLACKKAPALALTLESYRWQSSSSVFQDDSVHQDGPDHDQESSESGDQEFKIPIEFSVAPPSEWVMTVWVILLTVLCYHLVVTFCRCARTQGIQIPATAYNVNYFTSGFWNRNPNPNPVNRDQSHSDGGTRDTGGCVTAGTNAETEALRACIDRLQCQVNDASTHFRDEISGLKLSLTEARGERDRAFAERDTLAKEISFYSDEPVGSVPEGLSGHVASLHADVQQLSERVRSLSPPPASLSRPAPLPRRSSSRCPEVTCCEPKVRNTLPGLGPLFLQTTMPSARKRPQSQFVSRTRMITETSSSKSSGTSTVAVGAVEVAPDSPSPPTTGELGEVPLPIAQQEAEQPRASCPPLTLGPQDAGRLPVPATAAPHVAMPDFVVQGKEFSAGAFRGDVPRSVTGLGVPLRAPQHFSIADGDTPLGTIIPSGAPAGTLSGAAAASSSHGASTVPNGEYVRQMPFRDPRVASSTPPGGGAPLICCTCSDPID